MMKHQSLKERTQQFALDVIRFVETLPTTETCRVLGRQLLRCGTSVTANYRAACRGRSKSDFIAKMGVVLEEADESAFWIELLIAANKAPTSQSAELLHEADELLYWSPSQLLPSKPRAEMRKKVESASFHFFTFHFALSTSTLLPRLVGEQWPERRDDGHQSGSNEVLDHGFNVFVGFGRLFVEQVALFAHDPAAQPGLHQLVGAESLAHPKTRVAPRPLAARAVGQ